MATQRKSELDRFLEAAALPPRAIGRAGGGWTNYDVVVAVCGARGVHAVDAALYDAVSLRYERKVQTFAQAFAACLVGRRSLARMDLETLRACHPAFEALQLPESINEMQMAAQIGEWFTAQAAAHEEDTDMVKNPKNTVSGVCVGCGLIGVSITDGKAAAHNGRDGKPCSGKAPAAAPRAFVPRCTCDNKGMCRTCQVGDGIVQAFFALRSPARMGIGAPVVAAPAPVVPAKPAAPVAAAPKVTQPAPARTVVARKAPAAPAVPTMRIVREDEDGTRTDLDAPLSPLKPESMTALELVQANVEVAQGIVEAFQALREQAHARALRMAQLAAEAARASVEVAQMAAQSFQAAAHAAAPAALACYRCGESKPMGYVLDGRVCCRDCREGHRQDYYASRGRTAPAREPRQRGRYQDTRVASIHVRADHVTVAPSSAG